MDAPTNVLVADLQNGCQVFVKWTAPTGTPQGYYIYRCSTETGNYWKDNGTPVTEEWYIIDNLSLGDEIFVKVSAVDENGDETVLSSAGDDADIDLSPSIPLSATARVDDVIAAGSYFSAQLDGGGVITLQVASAYTFDGILRLWELDDDNYVEFQLDKMIYVLGGVTVAELHPEGWYLKGRKMVLGDLFTVISATDAPFEWDSARSTLFAIHTTPSNVRLMGIDTNGNMYLLEHDSQPYILPATDQFGLVEKDNTLIWGNGFYRQSLIDRDEHLFFVRGRIMEDVVFP